MTQTPNDPLYPQQDYLNAANVPQAWQTTTGSSSQKIAIISVGGVDPGHEDLSSRVTVEALSSGTDITTNNPLGGIVGAATNNGVGIAGINWNSPILSYDVGQQQTKQVTELPGCITMTETFTGLNTGSIDAYLNDAVSSGAITILMPINWIQVKRLFIVQV